MRTTLGIFVLALLIAAPALAQIELRPTLSIDALNLATTEMSEDRASMQAGVLAAYHMAPWSFSAEYEAGNSVDFSRSDLERSRAELAVAYSLSDSFSLTTGARTEDIRLTDVSYEGFFFFFIPIVVPVTRTEADLELMNFFVGANYESDRQRPIGMLASARVYRGSADVSTGAGQSGSTDSEGFRTELGVRWGPPDRAIILGAAYESFKLPDARIEIASKPVVFLQYRYNIRLP